MLFCCGSVHTLVSTFAQLGFYENSMLNGTATVLPPQRQLGSGGVVSGEELSLVTPIHCQLCDGGK